MKTYLVVYIGSGLLTVILTPLVARLAIGLGLVDAPGVRKVHTRPIPRVGGIVFVISLLSLVVPAMFMDNVIGDAFREIRTQLIALLATGVFIFLVGLTDDIRSLRAPLKLAALLGAAFVICLSGARIQTITVERLFTIDFGWVSYPLTMVWIAGVTVGINFIDGLDGLAAGIAAIVCATIAVFAFHSGQIAMFVLLLGLLGSLTGFLFFNFNPAKIFMGDSGSMFIGFMIAAGSVVTQAKSATLVGIALPALALGVPIIDTALTMIRRAVLDKRSIFSGERGHIHHRLLDRGLQHRTVVIVIYSVTLVAAAFGLLMLTMREGARIGVLAGGILFLLIVFALAGSTRIRETVTAIRRNITAAKERKQERNCFEDAQLKLREARSFEAWWDAICSLGRRMEFESLVLSWCDGENEGRTMSWRRSSREFSPRDIINVSIPLENETIGGPAQIELAVQPNGSVEATVRRVTFLGRLLDERPGLVQADSPPHGKYVLGMSSESETMSEPSEVPHEAPRASKRGFLSRNRLSRFRRRSSSKGEARRTLT